MWFFFSVFPITSGDPKWDLTSLALYLVKILCSYHSLSFNSQLDQLTNGGKILNSVSLDSNYLTDDSGLFPAPPYKPSWRGLGPLPLRGKFHGWCIIFSPDEVLYVFLVYFRYLFIYTRSRFQPYWQVLGEEMQCQLISISPQPMTCNLKPGSACQWEAITNRNAKGKADQ